MKIAFEVIPHTLQFKFEAGTSRGSFTEKETWFIRAFDRNNPAVFGWGEASPLKGLSIDYSSDYLRRMRAVLDHFEQLDIPFDSQDKLLQFVSENTPSDMPSLRFGVETVLLDLMNGGERKIFDSKFSRGELAIRINGLIWMGDLDFMQAQIDEKLKKGFDCIKMKIGAIDFDQELQLLEQIREQYTADEITLRVDANGAFSPEDAKVKLDQLAALDIHSIEQPIKPGQVEEMAELCASSLLPIALDEELIGVNELADKESLLSTIKPAYIILKPSLLGGILACKEWIEVAESMGIGWWMTSMLESNVGLNAIAQFTATYDELMHQGLGTGQLYHNNIESPLQIRRGTLFYNVPRGWGRLPG